MGEIAIYLSHGIFLFGKYSNNNNKEAERVQVERMRNEAGLSLCFSSDISSNLTKQHNTQEEEE